MYIYIYYNRKNLFIDKGNIKTFITVFVTNYAQKNHNIVEKRYTIINQFISLLKSINWLQN